MYRQKTATASNLEPFSHASIACYWAHHKSTDPLVATFLAEDGSQSHFKRSKSEACKITFISFLMSFGSLVAKFMEENTKQLDGQDPICCFVVQKK